MPVRTGTATSPADLMSELQSFLTDRSQDGGIGWALDNGSVNNTRRITSGIAPITAVEHEFSVAPVGGSHIGIQMYLDTNGPGGNFLYTLRFNMYQSYASTAEIEDQVGASNSGSGFHMGITIWPARSLPFFFIGNTHRIHVLVWSYGHWNLLTAGFLLQTSAPGDYPFPLVILGNTSNTSSSIPAGSTNEHFIDNVRGKGMLRDPSDTWRQISDQGVERVLFYPNADVPIPPMSPSVANNFSQMMPAGQGVFPLFACLANTSNQITEIYGELDGIYYANGAFTAFNTQVTDTPDYVHGPIDRSTSRAATWAARID